MYSKFKKGNIVIVNGVGKCNGISYTNEKAVIISHDSYFHDYNVRFTNETEDWINAECLTLYKDRRGVA